jgi:hypothetical protein
MSTETIIKLRTKSAELRMQQSELQKQYAQIATALENVGTELADIETAERVLQKLDVSNGEPSTRIQNAVVSTLRRTITKREQILTAVAGMLTEGTLTTDHMLDALAKQGIEITGTDRKIQLRNLSAYLSRAKADLGLEVSRNGWTLTANKGESPVAAGLSVATMSNADEQ